MNATKISQQVRNRKLSASIMKVLWSFYVTMLGLRHTHLFIVRRVDATLYPTIHPNVKLTFNILGGRNVARKRQL